MMTLNMNMTGNLIKFNNFKKNFIVLYTKNANQTKSNGRNII